MTEKGIQKRLIRVLENKRYSIMCQNNTDIPDVVARKENSVLFFELKDKLFKVDSTIGQCLRCIANTRVSGYSLKCSRYFQVKENRFIESWQVEPIEEVSLVVPIDSDSWYLKKLQILQKIILSLDLPIRLIIGTGEGLESSLGKMKPTNMIIKRMEGDENFLEYKAAKMDNYIELGHRSGPNTYRESLKKKLPYLPLHPDLVLSKNLEPFEEVLRTSKINDPHPVQ